MREHLERIALAVDEVMAETVAIGVLTPWEHVDWLRLHADLLDRLGAAAGAGSPVSGRGELVRDRAERMADRLNRLPSVERGPTDDALECLAVAGDGHFFRGEPAPER
ncbi:hypothetical protein FHS29_003119 [Saccharothrix tamanrassetensis]|uniref:Uncharacterized protein n=1 Tax=Saccharothrix tamanrassetensis TaxID=1051531 RepID=A0A841CHS4_9PSEU|nr:hypothetical protein [Saccharothrix tamanrassetensis]MBB5956533.1 hypothetical protein [Saccharothrix tamanrassetensis]